MLNFLNKLVKEKTRIKLFINEEDLYEGIISDVDEAGLVLDVGDFVAVLPLSSIYVIEVDK